MPFTFDPRTGRYRDPLGRLVSPNSIRTAVDTVLTAQAQTNRLLTQQLIDGTLTLGDWQLQMMQGVKSVHLVGLSAATGGWAQLDQSDFGWAGQRIRTQYGFLDRFARDIAAGRQLLTASAVARAEMYAEAGRATHRAAEQRQARQRGMEQERNVLGAADHCAGCLGATARGWVAAGSLVPCGSRNCLSRCHCHLVYRRTPAA